MILLMVVSSISANESMVRCRLDVLNNLIEFIDVGCFNNFILKYDMYIAKIIDDVIYIPADLSE